MTRLLNVAIVFIAMPTILLGLGLTASIVGAVVGVPLLVLAVPSAWMSTRLANGPDQPSIVRKLRGWYFCYCVVLSATLSVGLAVGAGDIDNARDLSLAAVGAVWLAAAWWTLRRVHELVILYDLRQLEQV